MCFMCKECKAIILLKYVISTLGNCNSQFTKLLFGFQNSSILQRMHALYANSNDFSYYIAILQVRYIWYSKNFNS